MGKLLSILVFILFFLVSCSNNKLSIPLAGILLEPQEQMLVISQTTKFEAPIDIKNPKVAVVASDGITSHYNNGSLFVTGQKEGSHTVEVIVSALGYQEERIVIPITVQFPQLEIKPIIDDGFDGSQLNFTMGKQAQAKFEVPTSSECEVNSTNANFNTQIKDGIVTIQSEVEGASTITIKCTAKRQREAEYSFKVFADPPVVEAQIKSSLKDNKLIMDTKGIITVTTQESSAVIDVYSSDDCIAVELRGKTVVLTPQNSGTSEILVTVLADGYKELTEVFTIEVLQVQTELSVSQNNIDVPLGASASIPIKYSGELEITNDSKKVEAFINGDRLILNGLVKGRGSLIISTSKDNYDNNTIVINFNVTTPVVQIQITTSNVKLAIGEEKPVHVGLKPDYVDITTSTDNNSVALAYYHEGAVYIEGISEGKTKIRITGTAENHNTGVAEITVEVTKSKSSSSSPLSNNTQTVNSSSSNVIEDIVKYTNIEREAAGLQPLRRRQNVDFAAAIRASECSESWSHTRPDGTDFYSILIENGISYTLAGENLASANYKESGEEVVVRWMNSEGHKENILESRFTEIAVGYYFNGEEYFYCQIFLA